MSTEIPGLLERRIFDAHTLMTEHPPIWRHRNKAAVFEIACPHGCMHEGELVYTRWSELPLPEGIVPAQAIVRTEPRDGVYDYLPALPGSVEWHVNFADPELFVAYGSPLLAQDELQVAEHPILGALREQLRALGSPTRTAEHGHATPVLVLGAQRRCRIGGLYGNDFAAAPIERARAATRRIDPPTISNIIAIAAPSGGRGRYTPVQIDGILRTAFSGFRAAVLLSGDARAAVHTGFWGCGAFGGDRGLMALLQILAAEAAGVERLAFHTHNSKAAFDAAVASIRDALPGSVAMVELAEKVADLGFSWGMSDWT